MRHRKTKITLDRNATQRRKLLNNLSISLITHKKITTSKARANAVRSMVEKLVTRARPKDVSARRYLMSILNNQPAVDLLIKELGPKFAKRNGGYLRVIKVPAGVGQISDRAIVEFIE